MCIGLAIIGTFMSTRQCICQDLQSRALSFLEVLWDQSSSFLSMHEESIVSDVRQLYRGGPPHYHRDIRACRDNAFPDRWIGRRRSGEYPPPPTMARFDHARRFLLGLLVGVAQSEQHFKCSDKTLNGLAKSSQRQLWWPQSVFLRCQMCH